MGWSWVTNQTGMPRRPRLRATARLPWAPPRIRAPRALRLVSPIVLPARAGPAEGAVMVRIFSRPRHRRDRARDIPVARSAHRRRVSAVVQHGLDELPRREGG